MTQSADKVTELSKSDYQPAWRTVMDLFFALKEIGGKPTMKDLVKLAKRLKISEESRSAHKGESDGIPSTRVLESTTATKEGCWRPFSTAPKDGTQIDVWAKSWIPLDDTFMTQRFTGVFWKQNGCWIGLESGWHPTHWMEIPPGPTETTPNDNQDYYEVEK